jgi:hypothetical protein
LREQLTELQAAPLTRRTELEHLQTRATELRAQLSAAQEALESITAAAESVEQVANSGARDFTRGRIDTILGTVAAGDDLEVQRLRWQRESVAAAVSALEAELDDNEDREQLTSRLLAVGREMTAYADRLQLEHAGTNVRLDLARLTVVTDTDSGPVPLYRSGSASNWIRLPPCGSYTGISYARTVQSPASSCWTSPPRRTTRRKQRAAAGWPQLRRIVPPCKPCSCYL